MSLLRWTAMSIFVCSMLGACASPPEPRSAYNDGVAAYRAKDYASARTAWQRAVSEGNTSAMNNLGYLLSRGLGGERDEAGAARFWTTAAMQGHSEAALHLGAAYEKGRGVSKSDVAAYAWYTCAVASARAASPDDDVEEDILKDANDALSTLMAAFPPEHFEAAQKLAQQYLQTYARK